MAKKSALEGLEPFDLHSIKDQFIIGIDEVGRGCLAGPVYAAAVLWNLESTVIPVTDSKMLSASRREKLSQLIFANHKVGIGSASVEEISELNILQATFLAMRRALQELGVATGHLLIDGNQRLPGVTGFQQTTLIKGDFRAPPIAAASIVAKVTRDRLMAEFAETYPGYGFEQHKGYSSKAHMEAIQKLGPCAIHRPTFAGVREYLPQSPPSQGVLPGIASC